MWRKDWGEIQKSFNAKAPETAGNNIFKFTSENNDGALRPSKSLCNQQAGSHNARG
jgi:hypothetical protein